MKRALTDSEFSLSASEFVWSQAGLSDVHEHVLPILVQWLRESGARHVLDVGSGNGALTSKLAQEGFTVVGIDNSETGIEIASRNYPAVSFVRHGVESPLPDELRREFDAVIAVEVIEHLLLPRQLFQRAREALKPGGRLIVTTPYHGYWKNLALALIGRFDDHWHPLRDFGHVKFFSVATLTQLFQEKYFRPTRLRRLGRVPMLAKSMIVEGVWGG
jgi:SAM-dependent methyltransferase